jgi:lipopolysaccharide export system protein LptA
MILPVCCAFFFFCALPLYAQQTNNSTSHEARKGERIILDYADEFIGRQINGEDVRELNGHVHLSQGNVQVWCDNAIQYLVRNEVDLVGSVKVVRDTVTLTARRGKYFGNEKRAEGEGDVRMETKHIVLLADFGTYYLDDKKAFFHQNVRVIDSTTTIFSDELTYFEKERKSIAVHHVRVKNSENDVVLFGDYLEHFDETHYTKLTQEPRLMKIDTSASTTAGAKQKIDTLVVKSIVMESYDDSTKKLIATDSVEVVRGPLAAKCGVLYYFTKKDEITLFRQPILWYEDNQVTGDTISLDLEKNKLKYAHILNRAFAISLSDSAYPSRYNQLTGRTIDMEFVNEKLHEISVTRNAVSLYYLYDGKDPNGANQTSGDAITMAFKNGKLDFIRVLKGIEGMYYPENMLKNNIEKYNLDGFNLRADRPKFENVFSRKNNL